MWGLSLMVGMCLVSAGGEMVHFLGYLSGFVHCFAGYSITFLHVSAPYLSGFGAGFIEICGKQGLIGVPPLPPCWRLY